MRKTFNRFGSLLIIILISTSFMMGLMSAPTIMRVSANDYAEKNNLQDVQLYSPYGFNDDDIAALLKSPVVDRLEASKQVDVFCDSEGKNNIIARVLEDDPIINKFELKEGSLPSKNNECVILSVGLLTENYEIGDKIKLHLSEGEDLTEQLAETEFVITGLVQSPAYASKMLGPSNLDNLDLQIVVYIPSSNFISYYYTTILLTIKGADEYTAYTDEYDEYITTQIKRLKSVTTVQEDKRKNEILAAYLEQIDAGRRELAVQKAVGEAQLESAKAQLDDAKKQIDEGEAQLSKYTSIINYAYDGYTEKRAELDARLADNNKKIKAIEKQSNLPFDSAVLSVTKDYASYKTNSAFINSTKDTIVNLFNEREEIAEQLNDPSSFVDAAALSLRYDSLTSELAAARLIYNTQCVQKIEENNALDAQYKLIGFAGMEDAASQIAVITAETTAIELLQDTIKETDDTVKSAKTLYDEQLKKLEDGKKQYEEGLKEYNAALEEFNKAIGDAEVQLDYAEQQVNELPDAEWTILDKESHYTSYMYRQTCKQMAAIGYSMPLLFYLVAALVCLTTMTRLIDEQRGQIGIYVALGYSKFEIAGKYISYAVAASLVGSVIGIVLGILIFPTVIYTAWRLMYVLPPIHLLFPPLYIVICALAFTGLVVAVTYFVVKKSVGESAASLMRPKAPKSSKPIFLEKMRFIWERLSFTSKVTARNLVRYKSRFFMTVLGVAGCTALLVVGWGIKDSVRDVVNIQYNDIKNYDVLVTAEDADFADDIQEILLDSSGVDDAREYMTYTTKVYFEDDEKTAIVEVFDINDSDALMNLRKTDHQTSTYLSNEGIIVTEKFAKTNNIEVGDVITIESAKGIKAKVVVDDICEMYVMHYIYMSDLYYKEIFGERVDKTLVAVTADSMASVEDALSDVEGVVSIYNMMDSAEQFNRMIKALDYIILVIILAAGSLALVVLFNLTQVNISERIREIATLKVLGFNDGEVNVYIFKEIAILSLIGALIGLPLGVVEHHFIMNIINMDMIMFGMNIKFASFAYAFLVTLAFTVIVLLWTKKTLRIVDMVESLKSVE